MGELALTTAAQRSRLVATVIRSGPVVGAPATHDATFESGRRLEDFVASTSRAATRASSGTS